MATAKTKAAPKPAKVTKKQVAVHRSKVSRDNSPNWDGAEYWTGEQFTKQFHVTMEHYRFMSSIKAMRPKILEWMEAHKFVKDDIAAFRKLKDTRLSSTMCSIAACLLRGMPLIHEGFNSGKDTSNWLRAEIVLALAAGANDKEDELSDAPIVSKTTIQDRLADKFSEAMGEIEGGIDTYFTEGKDFSVFKLLSGQNIAVQYATKIPALIQPRINDLTELLAGKDSQLIEAYSHLSKKEVKAAIKFYENIISDAMAYKTSKISTRAKPVRKAVPPEKQVKKLKFLKEFAALGLKSIGPTEILGVSELWVFNTKTRKIGRFVVPMHGDIAIGTLGVKGSAIVGYDEIRSTCKTLRKPDVQLKEFKVCGKPQLRKFMDSIKSVETKLKGRIAPDTILLRVIK